MSEITLGRNEPLAQLRPRFVGITLNYAPSFSFKVGKATMKWGHMTPDQQVRILDDHIDKVYKHHFRSVEYTFELTKQGNIHLHGMATIDINPDMSEYVLWDLRKLIGQHPIVTRYTKCNEKIFKRSNYIHYLKDYEDWKDYLSKHAENIPYKKRCILGYLI